eukprot:6468241-Pyramimonas_sp.AAC.1
MIGPKFSVLHAAKRLCVRTAVRRRIRGGPAWGYPAILRHVLARNFVRCAVRPDGVEHNTNVTKNGETGLRDAGEGFELQRH